MTRDDVLSATMLARVEPEAVPIPEAGRLLGVKRSKIYQLMGDGSLPSFKIGKRRLIRVAAVRELVARLQADSLAA